MKTFRISFIDLNGKKDVADIQCYSYTSAKVSFKKGYKGVYKEIISILSIKNEKSLS